MPLNTKTTVKAPLRLVGESSEVLLARIHGLIEPDGQGFFVHTEKGSTFQALLNATPIHSKEAVAREFLGLKN